MYDSGGLQLAGKRRRMPSSLSGRPLPHPLQEDLHLPGRLSCVELAVDQAYREREQGHAWKKGSLGQWLWKDGKERGARFLH